MKVLGIATAVPPHSIEQHHAAAVAEQRCCSDDQQRRLLRRAYLTSEIRKRHSVLLRPINGAPIYEGLFPPRCRDDDLGPTTGQRMEVYAREAPLLAVQAAGQALAKSGVPPRQITHVVTASCTGFYAPGLDFALMRDLDLSAQVGRVHVGFMGCHAAMNAIRVAKGFTAGDREARVLLCAVELCSLHFQYGWRPDQLVANALFADGAGALVLASDESELNSALRIGACGSCLLPATQDAMTWRIGDHGFEMGLSRRVPDIIRERLRGWMCEWLAGCGLTLPQVGSWAVHPGGPRIVTAVEEALGLDPSHTAASREVLADYGNMSSPTLLFILERLCSAQAAKPFVALGFGPGLTAESALLL